jgi:hypothetical protein
VFAALILLAGFYPAAAQDGMIRHVVQPGETLFHIAMSYSVTVDDLMRANGLTDRNMVYVGHR